MTFQKQLASLEDIFSFLDDFSFTSKCDAGSSYVVKLAVEEFFTNMVKYAPEGSEDIAIDIVRAGDVLTVRMVDRNVEPFDVTASPDVATNLTLDQRKPGGLGIHIVRQMVDSLEYNYHDRCSTITFTKNLEKQ